MTLYHAGGVRGWVRCCTGSTTRAERVGVLGPERLLLVLVLMGCVGAGRGLTGLAAEGAALTGLL